MKNTLLWLWCLPQNLVGLAVKHLYKAEKKGNHYRFNSKLGSVSLGEYIFLCPDHWRDITTLKHENGHRVQSRILGWLYLPVIAIPSLIWAGCFEWYRKKYNVSYYSFYTEALADKLAGIERRETDENLR